MTENLLVGGVEFVLWVQNWGDWLLIPMSFFSSLGAEQFYFLVMPALLWCLDARLGFRLGFALLLSTGVNGLLKLGWHAPRPFWVDPRVEAYQFEGSFGIPSGHSQNAVVLWGFLAAYLKKRWAWLLAFLVIFNIGLSRMYLGVHFPTDVLVGWFIGAILLVVFFLIEKPLFLILQRRPTWFHWLVFLVFSVGMLAAGILIVFGLNLNGWVLPEEWAINAGAAFPSEGPLDPLNLDGLITASGVFFGFVSGGFWIQGRGGFDAGGNWQHRGLRYIIGVAGVLVFWAGLGFIFPEGGSLIAGGLRFVRYSLVGLWISGIGPEVFCWLGLADRNPIL